MTTNTIKETNPILQSEFRYQRFVIERSRNGRFWIFLAILIVAPSVLISLMYSANVLFNFFPVMDLQTLRTSWHMNMLYILFVANISMYAVVTLVNVALSSSSIRREKDKHTWSLLRLTNISSNQIVLGKWWASIRALNGDLAMVIILRIGLLAIALGLFMPSIDSINGIETDYRLYFLLMTPLVILHGFLDAVFSAILGISGAIPDDTWQIVGGFSAFMIRLFVGIAVAWWFGTVIVQIVNDFTSALYTAGFGIIATIILIIISFIVAQVSLDRS